MSQNRLRITLLDVGSEKYGDCILCEFGDVSVLIDGAHPGDVDGSPGHFSIPAQIGYLLNEIASPYDITLLIITHPHNDHIGCLPALVRDGVIRAKWALVADPRFRWGPDGFSASSHPLANDERARTLMSALQEENRADDTRERLELFFNQAGSLEFNYRRMLADLEEQGTTVIRHGVDDSSGLVADLGAEGVRLEIIGPARDHLDECRRLLAENETDALAMMSNVFGFGAQPDLVDRYRDLASGPGAFFAVPANKGAINLQSIVTLFEYEGRKVLSAGDFQFAMPEVNSELLRDSVRRIRDRIRAEAPFYYYKLSHHASYNGFSEEIFDEIRGTNHLGVVGGSDDDHHPHKDVLKVLKAHEEEVTWVRTDRNGQSSVSFGNGSTKIHVSKGSVNDATPNSPGIDVATEPHMLPTEPATSLHKTVSASTIVGGQNLELTAKIPNQAMRVTWTVDVRPGLPTGAGAGKDESFDTGVVDYVEK